MYPIRPNKQRAKQIIAIFYIVLLSTLVNIGVAIWQYITFSEWKEDRSTLDMAVADQSDTIDRYIGIATIAITILTIVFFIRWFRRAYYNLHAIAPSEAQYEEGWAAGAWFIPVLNLFRPYQIMKEIWEGTQRALPHRFPTLISSQIVGVWWVFYVIMSVSGNISTRMAFSVEDIPDLVNSTMAGLVSECLTIPAIFVTIYMIKKMSSIEDELWEEALNPSDSIFAANPVEAEGIPNIPTTPDTPPAM